MSGVHMLINWLSWDADAFERARVQEKPVLLSIATTWSGTCVEMERTSYADPHVAALVNERFVPIRVDADRRPDIGDRYTLGGWPTTAFLTADGALLCGGTYADAGRLRDVLRQVSDAFALQRSALAAGPPDPEANGNGPTESAAGLTERIFQSFDADVGAFGVPPHFPHAAPVHLALALARDEAAMVRRTPAVAEGNEPADDRGRFGDIAATVLDAMGWSALYDDADGGFFRYANGPGWAGPQREKLLQVNAAMLGLYCDAFETLQFARYRERAEDVLRYLQTWLADQAVGGWAASQRPAADSRGPASPPIDPILYADWNAAAASAMFTAARVFADESLRDFALKSLERALLQSYRPGGGVAHWVEGCQQVRGLLQDHVAMAAASLDAYEATGNIVYEMMAEELAHFALRTMWDEARGGFFDRARTGDGAEIGLLRRPLKPFVANCEAARMLRRLAASSGDYDFADRAQRTLAAMEPIAPAHGPLAAHYVLALREASPR